MSAALQRIKERDEARRAEREQRRAEEESAGASDAPFDVRFSAQRRAVEAALAGDANAISQATLLLGELRQTLAGAAALGLPAHDLRQAQGAIDALQTQLAQRQRPQTTQQQPRKFAFSAAARSKMSPTPAATPTPKPTPTPEDRSDEWECEGFRDRTGETLVRARNNRPETDGQRRRDFAVARLRGCCVYVFEACAAVHIADLRECRVLLAPTARGSVYVDRCERCVFAVATQQLRIHTSSDCRFHVRCKSGPIIEDCTGLVFAPYRVVYPGLDEDLAAAGFRDEDDGELWHAVQDFNWIKSEPSPHFTIDEGASVAAVPVFVFASTDEAARPTN